VTFEHAHPLFFPRAFDFSTALPTQGSLRETGQEGTGNGAVEARQIGRTVLALFRGSLTHPVREAMVRLYNHTPGFVMRVRQ